jgi:hippurate hydrolase
MERHSPSATARPATVGPCPGAAPALQALYRAIQAQEPVLVALRRELHAHPELGFQELRTGDRVAGILADCGLEVHRGLGRTGVVGTLRGRLGPGRTVGLRADLDALAITERPERPERTASPEREYRSTRDGTMHACGHDGHTAMLLGAARHLAAHPDFAGTIQFIFQPAEEGLGGARQMLEDGLFRHFPVDAVYGLHNFPGMPAGSFGLRPGPMMAASDTWTVIFSGTGGHGGAGAHLATDPTVVLGQFIPALQSIIGRNVRAIDPAVLSIGYLQAGTPGSPNVIPSEVVVRGTARSFAPEVRDLLERRLAEVAGSLAAASHCTATVDYQRRYPPLVNAAAQAARAADVAASLVGAARVERNLPLVTAGEDFAFMLNEVPGAFMIIGNGMDADGAFHDLHTPHYDFNDGILCLGAAYWCTLALAELGA